jgi:hypothetical protein
VLDEAEVIVQAIAWRSERQYPIYRSETCKGSAAMLQPRCRGSGGAHDEGAVAEPACY